MDRRLAGLAALCADRPTRLMYLIGQITQADRLFRMRALDPMKRTLTPSALLALALLSGAAFSQDSDTKVKDADENLPPVGERLPGR